MRKIIIGIITFFCIFLVACRAEESKQEVTEIVDDSIESNSQNELLTTQKADNTTEIQEENVASVEFVDVEEFMEYYQMQNKDVPMDYIAVFIQHRQLTKDMLDDRNYDKMVKELYERGVTFGNKIVDLIAGEQVLLLEDEDFSDVAYIVMCKDMYIGNTDMSTEENIVLEVDNQKIYITQMSVTDDYTTEENVKDISEKEIRACLQELRNIITKEWEDFHMTESRVYDWQLYIVKQDGSHINYEGEAVDEEYHSGFEAWCGKYLN